MDRRTFIKGAVVAAATPTVTALADTPDHATLARLIDLHTRAYEADSAEWGKLYDIQGNIEARNTVPVFHEEELLQAAGYPEQRNRCEDAKTVVERMEAAIFAYQLRTLDDVLMLTRWVHARLDDCRCYFYQDERTVHSIFTQIARTV